MSGTESPMNEDQDLRQLLEAHQPSTSAAHDAAVLQAARSFSQSDAPLAHKSSTPGSVRRARQWLVVSWAVAAGVVAIIVTGASWREQALHHQVQALTEQRAALTRTVIDLQGRVSVPQVVMLLSPVLHPGITRGDESVAVVAIAQGVNVIRLRLELATTNNQPSYELNLATRTGKQVWQGEARTVQAQGPEGILSADVPVSSLGSGEYELSVRDSTKTPNAQTDYYYFKVRRE